MSDGSSGTREIQQYERLTRLEVKLDTVCEKLDDLVETIGTRLADHEKRLNRVERVTWVIAGVFSLFGVPILLMLISQFIGQLF